MFDQLTFVFPICKKDCSKGVGDKKIQSGKEYSQHFQQPVKKESIGQVILAVAR